MRQNHGSRPGIYSGQIYILIINLLGVIRSRYYALLQLDVLLDNDCKDFELLPSINYLSLNFFYWDIKIFYPI